MSIGAVTIDCRLKVVRVDPPFGGPEAVTGAFAARPGCSILGGGSSGRFSYWASEPMQIVEFRPPMTGPFEAIQQLVGRYRLAGGGDDLPDGVFRGGWLGWFGYELGRYIERMGPPVRDDLGLAYMRLCFYDRLVCHDRLQNAWWLLALDIPGQARHLEEKIRSLQSILYGCRRVELPPDVSPPRVDDVDFASLSSNMDRNCYLRTVEQIRRDIRDGLVYQVNFSQRFHLPFAGSTADLYRWQNRWNPSPYAAYIDAGDCAVVSASPEMFISIDGDTISTRPIKGTRPRLAPERPESAAINTENLRQLLESEKERAELNMIIDLERNDLGRICSYGTIEVCQDRTIQAYPTVFHALATVRGTIRPGIGLADVMKAMFPGGSITGAPKYAAMQAIERLEPTARGVYTGSIGFIGVDGTVRLNIAIRTIIIAASTAYVQVGGGIVADSSAQAEWNETITKARALVAGIISVREAAERLTNPF